MFGNFFIREEVALKLGAHESTAGGFFKALQRGKEDGAECVQIFCKSPRQWRAGALGEGEVEKFKEVRRELQIENCLVHASYLLNLGDPREEGYRRSIGALREELERTERLGIEAIVFHPGAHKKSGEEDCLRRISRALDEILSTVEFEPPVILLETTAGQGTNVGYKFEHLARIIEGVKPEFQGYLGVCLDTAHIFAAGYDIRTEESYRETFEEFERVIGLSKLGAFHLNDSLKPFGSRVDRHTHIGEGEIGLDAFRLLVNDPRFVSLPGYVETPALPDGSPSFAYNLEILYSLRQTGDGDES